MPEKIVCAECKRLLLLPAEVVGRLVMCPVCRCTFTAQSAAAVEPDPLTLPILELVDKGPPRPAAQAPADASLPLLELVDTPAPRQPPPPAPPGRRSPSGKPRGFRYPLVVEYDSDWLLHGRVQGVVGAEGIWLCAPAGEDVFVPVSSPARYLDGKRLSVKLGERILRLRVGGVGSYPRLLARDLVAFLNGDKPSLRKRDYGIPNGLLLPILLPLGIPVVTLGGVLPSCLGGGLTLLCLGISQEARWPLRARWAGSLACTLAGYLLLAFHTGTLRWPLADTGDKSAPRQAQRKDAVPESEPEPEPPPPQRMLPLVQTLPPDRIILLSGVAFAPDSHKLAVAGTAASVWDVGEGTSVKFDRQGEAPRSTAFAPDGSSVAFGGSLGGIWLGNPANGEVRRILREQQLQGEEVRAVAYSPDGKTLAAFGSETLTLWDLPAGTLRHSLPGGGLHGWTKRAAFSPDGTLLATSGGRGIVVLRDPRTGQETGRLGPHGGEIEGLAFAPDGKLLVTAGTDGSLKLWDPAERRELAQLRGNIGPLHSAAFSPGGQVLAAGGHEGSVCFWDIRTRKVLFILKAHPTSVEVLAFAPGRPLLATGVADGTVRLWDVAALERLP